MAPLKVLNKSPTSLVDAGLPENIHTQTQGSCLKSFVQSPPQGPGGIFQGALPGVVLVNW